VNDVADRVRWRTPNHLPTRTLLLDVVFAGVAVYFGWLLTSETLAATGQPEQAVPAHAVAALHAGVVAVRRLLPWVAAAGLILTAALFGLALELPVYMLGPAVLFVAYGGGVMLPRREAVVHLAVLEAGLVLLLRLGPSFPGWDSVVLYAALIGAAWSLGAVVRRWELLAAENARRAAELEQARLQLARHAVAAERLRIARELHDVVAHSMSVIAMHAGAARLAVGNDPKAERANLAVIERASRSALEEMRRLVTVLRDHDDSDGTETVASRDPAPSLAGLHDLVAGIVDAGVTVDVRTDGALDDVPAGVSLSAYRIVQEALTNVVRHAGPTRARLAVSARDGVLR
jgi:signal transduction histidine kinase